MRLGDLFIINRNKPPLHGMRNNSNQNKLKLCMPMKQLLIRNKMTYKSQEEKDYY